MSVKNTRGRHSRDQRKNKNPHTDATELGTGFLEKTAKSLTFSSFLYHQLLTYSLTSISLFFFSLGPPGERFLLQVIT